MPHYFLAVNHDEADTAQMAEMTPEQMQPMFEAVGAFNEALQEAGAWVFAGGLHGPDTATVVRASAEEVLLTDGPWIEAKEHLGGLCIISAPDLDVALQWAGKAARATTLPIEVRAFLGG